MSYFHSLLVLGTLSLITFCCSKFAVAEKPGPPRPHVNLLLGPYGPYPYSDSSPYPAGPLPGGLESQAGYHVVDPVPFPAHLSLTPAEVFRHRAQDAFSHKQYDQAARFASHALIEDHKDGRLHILLAHALLASQDFDGATQSLLRGLELLGEGHLERYLHEEPEYYSESERRLHLKGVDSFLRLNQVVANTFLLRGYHRLALGDTTSARADFESVLAVDDSSIAAKKLLNMTGPGSIMPPQPEAAPEILPLQPAPLPAPSR